MKKNQAGKGRDLDKTRRSILDAAAKEFAAHGFSGARVDRISRAAGVNKAMIYYIFKNKDELHLAVLENLFEEKIREAESHLQGRALSLETLFPVLQGYFKILLKKRDYAAMILYDLAAGAESLRALKERRPDLYAELDVFVDWLKALTQAGVIREVDPEKSVVLIVLIVVGLASLLPHMDVVVTPEAPAFASLSSQNDWLAFMTEVLGRVLNP